MVNLTIDGRPAQVPEGTTILEAARQADIHIPHLCYLKGINEIAACRVCCVEVEGERAMVTACNNPVQEGMAVHTNSPRARSTRRINVELILSQHDCKCATCVRSGNCQLQEIANDLGILELPFEIQLPQGLRKAWTTTFPLFHDYNKCIKCMRCIQVCDKIQSLSIWDVAGTGSRTTIDVSNNRVIKDSDCALCGQCLTACPGGCVGGGGQPIDKEDRELGGIRGDRLHQLDGQAPLRFSHENPQVQALYREFLGKPLSEISEYLLHSDHTAWAMPNQRETE